MPTRERMRLYTVMLEDTMVRDLERYQKAHSGISRNEAVRQLIEAGFEAKAAKEVTTDA